MKLKKKESPGLTFVEICESFQLTKGNISIHLKNLEKEKMIVKHFSLSNKKVKDIYLKEKLKDIECLILT